MRNQHTELLTVQEVARILRVNDITVRRWVRQGSLEAITLPSNYGRSGYCSYRIKRETLDGLLVGQGAH